MVLILYHVSESPKDLLGSFFFLKRSVKAQLAGLHHRGFGSVSSLLMLLI
jgi:hypothetical protein